MTPERLPGEIGEIELVSRTVRGRRTILLGGVAALAAGGAAAAVFAASNHASNTASVSPENRLIVLDHSIGPVSLGESRKRVEKALGPGTRMQRCGATYFGGRLEVNYCPKEYPTKYVAGIWTHWAGFHTRSGLRVGASRQMASSIPGMTCGSGFCDHYLRPRHADGPVTDITTRHRTVTEIGVFFG
jgi:hypothetical protein